jgi:hypothetical protein
MDHVVYIDAKDGDLQKLLDGSKTMIIRGAAGRKLPYDRVHAGDRLYFVQNNGEAVARAAADVRRVIQSAKLDEEQARGMVAEYQPLLQLTPAQEKRWSCKRYLVLIEIAPAQAIEPFAIDRSAYGNMDDWLPVGDIAAIRVEAGPQAGTR